MGASRRCSIQAEELLRVLAPQGLVYIPISFAVHMKPDLLSHCWLSILSCQLKPVWGDGQRSKLLSQRAVAHSVRVFAHLVGQLGSSVGPVPDLARTTG